MSICFDGATPVRSANSDGTRLKMDGLHDVRTSYRIKKSLSSSEPSRPHMIYDVQRRRYRTFLSDAPASSHVNSILFVAFESREYMPLVKTFLQNRLWSVKVRTVYRTERIEGLTPLI